MYIGTKVKDVEGFMGTAKTTMRTWQNKIFQKKAFMYVAAISLLIVNVTLIVLMFEHHGHIVA